MEKLNYLLLFIAALFVASTAFLVLQEKQQINVYNSQANDKSFLNVEGSYEGDVSPDRVSIFMTVVTNASTAKEAQAKNRVIANRVYSDLEAAGISRDDIETTGYSVNHLTFYNYERNKNIDNGYEVRNSFKIKTTKLDLAGELIDVASQAGINDIDNIVFDMTDKKSAAIRNDYLAKAASNAKAKAEVIASAAGVRVGKVSEISESYYFQPPVMEYAAAMRSSKMMADSAPTPIAPSDVHTSATVNVRYFLE